MNEGNPNKSIQQLREELAQAEKMNNESEVLRIENEIRGLELEKVESSVAGSEPENLENNNEEVLEQKIEQELQSFESSQEKISALSNELGGQEGVMEVIKNMSQEERDILDQKILEKQNRIQQKTENMKAANEATVLDLAHHTTMQLLDFSDNWKSGKEAVNTPVVGEAVATVLASFEFMIGIVGGTISGPMRGIQQAVRNISIRLEKKKLRKLENQLY